MSMTHVSAEAHLEPILFCCCSPLFSKAQPFRRCVRSGAGLLNRQSSRDTAPLKDIFEDPQDVVSVGHSLCSCSTEHLFQVLSQAELLRHT